MGGLMPHTELVGYKAIAHFFGWDVGGPGERRVIHLADKHGLPLIRSGTGSPVRANPQTLIAWVREKSRTGSMQR